ncbi:Tfp pilus assembly protein PilF [Stenotrophomonas rhizophila]|uniref:tetratricopeptide repeat protein n=1 Tax=Stenotrophomonas rhizophila TaxID=216778 RepID=UPI000F4AFD7E|nr:tetratricopeptide repeat protein [Stenotrophomonas rhizophila]ROP77029.1 Tfp pilus assembly protein PilF [Stenotrophomonas rhizophila]
MTGCRLLMLWMALAAVPVWAAEPAAPPLPAAPVTTELPTPAQILEVPAPLLTLLHEQVIDPGYSRERRLQRLVDMIFDAQGLHLAYDPDATHTINETWQTRRANCLSFTLLFVTLANLAGIDAHVQEVAQVVSWYQAPGVIYSIGHVNAGIVLDGRSGTVDLDHNVLYDRNGPQKINEQRALAHFYNNRGADRMAAGDTAGARTYFRAALAQAPDFVGSWNNLGVLAARVGDLDQARRDYETALRLQPRHGASLSNASALYRRVGDTRQAQRLAGRLARVQRSDPFAQYMLGARAEQRRDYPDAVKFYRRAVRLYDSAHPFHFALARAYFLAGDPHRASQEMQRARDLAGENGDAVTSRYQAKLDSLQRWRQRGTNAH